MRKIVIQEVMFPRKADTVDYFKAAVFYLISDTKPVFTLCESRNESELEDPRIKALIKNAVPGYNSTLMRLEINSNINEHIIKDDSLELNQKIQKISDSIRKYVQYNVA